MPVKGARQHGSWASVWVCIQALSVCPLGNAPDWKQESVQMEFGQSKTGAGQGSQSRVRPSEWGCETFSHITRCSPCGPKQQATYAAQIHSAWTNSHRSWKSMSGQGGRPSPHRQTSHLARPKHSPNARHLGINNDTACICPAWHRAEHALA